MSLRSSKRIYSQIALEAWFERLTSNWERFFSDEILASARLLYREGTISEIELTADDAIVHCKRKKQETYALLEWSDKRLSVRSSTRNSRFGRSLAAAGLYEIEELVADEITAIPGSVVDGGNGRGKKGGNAATAVISEDKSDEQNVSAARSLVLSFSSSSLGLSFDAHWKDEKGQREGALFRDGNRACSINLEEREKLIHLAIVARRVGFELRSHRQNYLLRDPDHIVPFLRNGIPEWREHFKVELDKGARALSLGIQKAKVEAETIRVGGRFGIRWRLSVGQTVLSECQIHKFLRRCRESVILPEIGIIRVEEEAGSLLESWQDYLRKNDNAEIPRYMLFSLSGRDEIRICLSQEIKSWRDQLASPSRLKFDLPKFLRPYQRRGVEWLARLCDADCHGLLADEMGLGKTVQVASLIALRPIHGMSHLVVCPASVVPVWKNELKRFFPQLQVEVLKSGHTFSDSTEPAIWLTSYTQLRRHKALLGEMEFGYAVLDEAQFIKNPEAKVSVATTKIRAKHRLVLTGTPLENRYLDLWSLFRYLMPGLLGGRRKFELDMAENGRGAPERLKQQIAPFVLRRTKEEVLQELPPKVEMELICPLTELQQQEYIRLTEQGVAEFGDELSPALHGRGLAFFTLLTRLRQVCCDPDLLPWLEADLKQSGKISFLLDKVTEALAGRHKVVIFSQFVALLKRVRQGLEARSTDIAIFELTGKTRNREKPVRDFQETESGGVILVSLRAGGTGITLHSADYVFILDPWWNPAVEEQAVDRVHRIGQNQAVFVYRMVTEGTVEERIECLKSSKREIFDHIVGELSDVSIVENHFRSLSDLIALVPGNNHA